MALIEINSDSAVWQTVRHLLTEHGYKYYLQQNLYGPELTLFVEPATEPEGGRLVNGLLVYDGGRAGVCSQIEEIRQEQIQFT